MPPRHHLVIVLPGIGGSVLARPGRLDRPVWDAGPGDIAGLAVRAARLSLAEAPRLEPIGLVRSARLLGFTVVHGYERLLDQLAGFGTVDGGHPERAVPDADVVVVPYDFRYGIEAAAERLDAVVSARLADLSEADRAGRVIVVAHSMGGLVARLWLGPMGRWPWCRTLITLGTPHRGAPKALDWRVNGVRLLGRTLSGPTALVREWPSVAQLLPRYPAVRTAGADPVALYPHELPVESLAGAREAYDLHLANERAWAEMPRSGPEVVACIGWSHRTPDALSWDGSALRASKVMPDWLGLVGWEKDLGDGTVPAYSALPPELDNAAHGPVRLADRHGPLGCAAVVGELLARYEGRRPPRMVHGAEDGEHPPALGLDLDEMHAAGEPIPVAAEFREVTAELSGHPVWATLRPTGTGEPVDLRLDWDSRAGCFRGVLAGQPPGLYEVSVSARAVPAAGDLATTDTLAVVADD